MLNIAIISDSGWPGRGWPSMAFQTDARVTRQKQITSLAVYHEAVETVVEGAEYRWPKAHFWLLKTAHLSRNPTTRLFQQYQFSVTNMLGNLGDDTLLE